METLVRIGELSRRLGVSVDVLRAWEHRYGVIGPTRSAGGFRLYSAADEARLREMRRAMDAGLAPAQAARSALATLPLGAERPADPQRMLDALLEAVGRFDADASAEALEAMIDALGLERAMTQGILPAMVEVGDRWARGELTVGHEHFAANLVQARLRGVSLTEPAGGRCAVLACAPGETHELGLMCHAIALRLRDWRVVYLGADTPAASLAAAVRSVAPQVTVVCAHAGAPAPGDRRALRRVAAATDLYLAGAAATASLTRACGATHLPGDPVAAAIALTG